MLNFLSILLTMSEKLVIKVYYTGEKITFSDFVEFFVEHYDFDQKVIGIVRWCDERRIKLELLSEQVGRYGNGYSFRNVVTVDLPDEHKLEYTLRWT